MCTSTGKVINFKRYGSTDALDTEFNGSWLYIGRANSHAGLEESPLANPFKAKDFGGRGKTIPHYRRWLWARIQAGDEKVINALHTIDDSTTLVCWCKPGPCHGDVVQAAATWLQTQMDEASSQIAFVSGHRDLKHDEFVEQYQPHLDKAIADGCRFVIGDAMGADKMSQRYVVERVEKSRVAIYHAGRHPRFNAGFSLFGGYPTQTAKDTAMTAVSDYDIAWVRSGKGRSGTARNLARRQ